ncbi:protein of unknown function [Methanoculleus bourgensis]|uniref:Uncharacterized protein n=1 Tax=Methanoculleus bourgensis TaxID=83986 RepID=A0A0X3BJW6_9EURY|nr:protein of unknown function [Methanoculleus bourgensis]
MKQPITGAFHLIVRVLVRIAGRTREDAKFGCRVISSPSRSSRLRVTQSSHGSIRCNDPLP